MASVFFCLQHAPAYAAGAGTSAATFLQLGFGSRPLAMGEAFVAVADDASALYYNPAGLAFSPGSSRAPISKDWDLLAAHALHIQDISISQMGLMRRPFGLSVTYLSMNDIEGRSSETEDPDSVFGASDLSVGLSCAKSFNGIGLGITGKLIRETIGTYSSDTFAVDLGSLYRLQRLPVAFGASISNLGGRVRFVDQSAPLPMTLRAGVSGGMTHSFPATISFQVDVPNNTPAVYRAGLEYLGFGPFALRAGYLAAPSKQKEELLGRALGSSSSEMSQLFGFFMGTGFRFMRGSLDYALVPYGELGTAHRFSMNLRF